MINKIEFSAKNLTSNAGLFLLLEHAKKNEIFDLIDQDLVFDNISTNKIKMNHIKTLLCGNFVGIDKVWSTWKAIRKERSRDIIQKEVYIKTISSNCLLR